MEDDATADIPDDGRTFFYQKWLFLILCYARDTDIVLHMCWLSKFSLMNGDKTALLNYNQFNFYVLVL